MQAVRALMSCTALLAIVAGASAQALEKTLFVTNQQSGTVSSLRVHYDGVLELVGAYPAGPMPQDCAITADGRHLVVLNSFVNSTQNEELCIFEIRRDSTLGRISSSAIIGDAPMSLCVTPTGYALTASTVTDSLASIALAPSGELSFTSSASTAGFPTDFVCINDTEIVYVLSSTSPEDIVHYTLSRSGQLTRGAITEIAGGAAFGAAVAPSGEFMYVSTGQLNLIHAYRINRSTGGLTMLGAINPGGNSVVELAMSPRGDWLFSAHVLSDEVRVSRINQDGTLSPTGNFYRVGLDLRDVETDGKWVFATDETILGLAGGPGVRVLRLDQATGSLTPVGGLNSTGGERPQFMAIWKAPECQGDGNGDGRVDFADITEALRNVGTSGPLGDTNGDSVVNFSDVSNILANIGPCRVAAVVSAE